MVQIEDIYFGAARMITELIKQEFRAQGHSFTGAWEDSLDFKINKNSKTATLTGLGLSYGKIVNDGLLPAQITKSMIPGLVKYFLGKGYSQNEATAFALNTWKKWKQEGTSTQASKRFSKTGARQNFMEAVFIGKSTEIDNFIFDNMDLGIDDAFRKVKDETI